MTDQVKIQQVLKAAEKIVQDFGQHKTADYFAGFDPNATFIFYTHTERLNSRAEYQDLWAKWESEDGFRVHSCSSANQKVQLLSDVAIFTHDVTSEVEFGGEISTLAERETIVFHLQGSNWVAVHEHLSPAAN